MFCTDTSGVPILMDGMYAIVVDTLNCRDKVILPAKSLTDKIKTETESRERLIYESMFIKTSLACFYQLCWLFSSLPVTLKHPLHVILYVNGPSRRPSPICADNIAHVTSQPTNERRNECPLDLTREVSSSCILYFKVEQSIWRQTVSHIATSFRKLRKNVKCCRAGDF